MKYILLAIFFSLNSEQSSFSVIEEHSTYEYCVSSQNELVKDFKSYANQLKIEYSILTQCKPK